VSEIAKDIFLHTVTYIRVKLIIEEEEKLYPSVVDWMETASLQSIEITFFAMIGLKFRISHSWFHLMIEIWH